MYETLFFSFHPSIHMHNSFDNLDNYVPRFRFLFDGYVQNVARSKGRNFLEVGDFLHKCVHITKSADTFVATTSPARTACDEYIVGTVTIVSKYLL